MLGPQLEFIFTKCLQKEKNIFFLRIRHLILPQKLLKTKFVKPGPIGRQGQVESWRGFSLCNLP